MSERRTAELPMTVRMAARKGVSLDGSDSQALEAALQQAKHELVALRLRLEALAKGWEDAAKLQEKVRAPYDVGLREARERHAEQIHEVLHPPAVKEAAPTEATRYVCDLCSFVTTDEAEAGEHESKNATRGHRVSPVPPEGKETT